MNFETICCSCGRAPRSDLCFLSKLVQQLTGACLVRVCSVSLWCGILTCMPSSLHPSPATLQKPPAALRNTQWPWISPCAMMQAVSDVHSSAGGKHSMSGRKLPRQKPKTSVFAALSVFQVHGRPKRTWRGGLAALRYCSRKRHLCQSVMRWTCIDSPIVVRRTSVCVHEVLVSCGQSNYMTFRMLTASMLKIGNNTVLVTLHTLLRSRSHCRAMPGLKAAKQHRLVSYT